MKTKWLSLLLAALLLVTVVGVTGCGSDGNGGNGGGGGAVTPGGEELTPEEEDKYFTSFDAADYPVKDDITVTVQLCGLGRVWMDTLADNYKKITGINVKVKESEDATEELISKLSINAGLSDLYFDWSGSSLRDSWANKGKLVDLSDLVDIIPPFITDAMAPMNMYKEKYYTLPFAYQPVGFVYNQEYLDQIESNGAYTKGQWPSTWKGLLDLCEATQKSNLRSASGKVQPLAFGGTVRYLTYLFNGLWDQVDPEGFEAYWHYTDKSGYCTDLFKTDSTLKVMQAIRDLLNPQTKKDGSYYPANAVVGATGINHTKAQTMFLNGASVAVVCGSWFENEMLETIDEQDFYHFGGVPVLDESKPQTAFINVPGEHFTVPAKGKSPEGGKQFLKFILQEQNLKLIHSIIQTPLAYQYDKEEVKLTQWGKEVNDVVINIKGTITFTDSDVMRSGALTIFGSEDPFNAMSTKGISAKDAIDAEVTHRVDNYDYFLNFIPKN